MATIRWLSLKIHRVLIGVTEYEEKEFLAIEDGYRESEQTWREVLLNLKSRGLERDPKLAALFRAWIRSRMAPIRAGSTV